MTPFYAFCITFSDPNESNTFDAEGVFVEEIKLNYEIAERIGLGGGYTFEGADTGAHTLTASTFFADTSFLSESVGTKRGNADKSDGDMSNTEDLSSFVVSLEGENIAGVENLYYKLAYRRGDTEAGYVATLGHTFPITERMNVDALVEFVDIDNFEAGLDDNQYFTTSVITTLDGQWSFIVGYTLRDIDVNGEPDVDDHLFQTSANYDLEQGTRAEIGWKQTEEAGVDSDIVGGLIRHTFEF